MKRYLILTAGLGVLMVMAGHTPVGGLAETSTGGAPSLDGKAPAPLSRGDHNDNEILRFRTIRAERQDLMLPGHSPVACSRGREVYVAAHRARPVQSRDGGRSWQAMPPVPDSGDPAALGCLKDGRVLLAVSGQDGTRVLSFRETAGWEPLGSIPGTGGAAAAGGVAELADGSLLLSLSRRIYHSGDGRRWQPWSELPPGWTTLSPLSHSSGPLLGALLYEGQAEDGAPYRNTFLAESNDQGRTWRLGAPLTRRGQIPGNLVRSEQGDLILSYVEETDPYGARALLAAGGRRWSEDVFVLGVSRYGSEAEPTPALCSPSSRVTTLALPEGELLSVYDRGACGDAERSSPPAVQAVRWKPAGLSREPLAYPELWSYEVDRKGYLDNGWVRMRPDDRFEGGDYIEAHEMMVFRRLPARQLEFPGIGAKGVVLSRHPDGSLLFSSRQPVIYRSTDEGESWKPLAPVERRGINPSSFGFGVTSKGTLLVFYADLDDGDRSFVARSTDSGRSWEQIELPSLVSGRGDSCRAIELSDGTIISSGGHARAGAYYGHWASIRGYNGDLILRSRDDGRTWGDHTILPPGSHETNFLELPSGRLLIATRYQRAGALYDLFKIIGPQPLPSTDQKKGYYYEPDWPDPAEYEKHPWWGKPGSEEGMARFKNEAVMFSMDGGYTYNVPELVTRIQLVSADLTGLPDGRVVLSYDHKPAPYGVRALISRDQGATWEKEIYAVGYGERRRGRPSSIALRDGRIYTIYQEKGDGIKATIWSPE